MAVEKFNLLSFQGKMRTLHFSWVAFFITFVVWFNAAPLHNASRLRRRTSGLWLAA